MSYCSDLQGAVCHGSLGSGRAGSGMGVYDACKQFCDGRPWRGSAVLGAAGRGWVG